MPAQLLCIGDQVVDRGMTRPAHVDPLLHLFPGVPFFEPLVGVQGPWNEVMEIMGFFTSAEFTEHRYRIPSGARQARSLLGEADPGHRRYFPLTGASLARGRKLSVVQRPPEVC